VRDEFGVTPLTDNRPGGSGWPFHVRFEFTQDVVHAGRILRMTANCTPISASAGSNSCADSCRRGRCRPGGAPGPEAAGGFAHGL